MDGNDLLREVLKVEDNIMNITDMKQKREAHWILLLRSCLKQKKNRASVLCFRTKKAFPDLHHPHTV